MRKLLTIVLATGLLTPPAADAAPVNFARGPQHAAASPQPKRRALDRLRSPLAALRGGPRVAAPTAAGQPAAPVAAREGAPTPELLRSFATTAESQGKPELARQSLQRAVGLAPSDVATLRAAGHFEDRQGELVVAESLYRRAVAAAPEQAGALNDLAICLARQGRLDESVVEFTKAIERRPDKVLYRNNVAKVLVELDDPTSAIVHLTAVHGKAVGHYNLGQLLSLGGKQEAAAEQFELALKADPSLTAARQSLAALGKPVGEEPKLAAAETIALPPAPAVRPTWIAPTSPVAVATPQPAPAAGAYPAAGPYPAVASPTFPRLLPPVLRQR